jgi:ATP adenylyltransferase
MRYLSGGAQEDGCVFCNRVAGDNDVAALILHRGEHTFIIMNLFPYSSGHVMIVPNRHVADPADLTRVERHENADMLPIVTSVLRRTLNCDGFNAGFNFGEAAGAGIAKHLHQHVVPRWVGDANFMPIIASTRVLPELLPSGYAKIRAELSREIHGSREVPIVVLVDDDRSLLLAGGDLPVVRPEPNVPVWRSAVLAIRDSVDEIEIAGWAGSSRADAFSEQGLVLRGRFTGNDRVAIVSVDEALLRVTDEHRQTIERGLEQLAPRH